MADDQFNATLLPNVIQPNGKLTIRFDSTGKYRSASNVTLMVFEANDQDALEPLGKGTPMLTFKGELKENQFVSAKDPDITKVKGAQDKVFDSSLDYADRTNLVKPNPEDGTHYATSTP